MARAAASLLRIETGTRFTSFILPCAILASSFFAEEILLLLSKELGEKRVSVKDIWRVNVRTRGYTQGCSS